MEGIEGEQIHISPDSAGSIGENRVEQGIDWGKIRQEMYDHIEEIYSSRRILKPLHTKDHEQNTYCMNKVGSVDNASRWFRMLGEAIQLAKERGMKIAFDPTEWERDIVNHEIAHMQQAIRFGIDPREIEIGFEIGHVDQFDPSSVDCIELAYRAFVRLRDHKLTPGQEISLALAPEKPCPTTDVPQAITILRNNLDLLSKRPRELMQVIILLNTKAGLSFSDIARILIESPPVNQALDELTESLDELSEILDKLMIGLFDKMSDKLAEVLDKLKTRVSQSRKPGNKK